MALHEIDQTLARLRNAADAVSANLVELDRDPYHDLLKDASLIGESATRWSEARKALADLWQWFRRFNDVLEQAATLRGTRTRLAPDDEARLDALLSGPSIELASAEIPWERRDLLANRASTTRCTPDELLAHMSAAFDRAKTVVAAIGQAWDSSLSRLRAAEARLDELTQLAVSLGEDSASEPARLRARLAKLGELLIKDPLSVPASELGEVERRAEVLRHDLEAAAQLRAEVVDQFARARAVIGELQSAARAAAEAHREATAKIASPEVPAPMAVDRAIAQQLSRAEALSDEGKWLAAQRELADWEVRADELLHRLYENAAANRLPVEERNQLRGRLDAYRAKVHRLGRIEDPALSALYDAARDALYTAPTDLNEAAALVRRYQGAVPAEPPRKVPM